MAFGALREIVVFCKRYHSKALSCVSSIIPYKSIILGPLLSVLIVLRW